MHLVMAARLLGEDPEGAYAHAQAARRHGPRVAVIREALGIAAYHAGKYAEALAELRAARRISGNQEHWPLMADCERALGHPEKALAMAAAPEVAELTRAARVEMRIVAAGARADLGQLDAAVVTLQSPELNDNKPSEWSARLRYAYAAALEAVGRTDEARTWFERAEQADPEGVTDAAERIAELDGVVFLSDEEFDEDDEDSQPGASPISTVTPEEPEGGGLSADPTVAVEPAVEPEVQESVAEPIAEPIAEATVEAEEPAVEAEEAVAAPPGPALATVQAASLFREPALAPDQAAALFREPAAEYSQVELFSQTALTFDEPAEESDASARNDG